MGLSGTLKPHHQICYFQQRLENATAITYAGAGEWIVAGFQLSEGYSMGHHCQDLHVGVTLSRLVRRTYIYGIVRVISCTKLLWGAYETERVFRGLQG